MLAFFLVENIYKLGKRCIYIGLHELKPKLVQLNWPKKLGREGVWVVRGQGCGEECGYELLALRPNLLAICLYFFSSKYLIYYTLLIIPELYRKLKVIRSPSRSW